VIGLLALPAAATPPGQYRLQLTPEMLSSSSPLADFRGLVDEQLDVGDPPAGTPTTGWQVATQHNAEFPFACVVDLGVERPLARLWLFDTHNIGEVLIQAGSPDAWQEVAVVKTESYLQWRSVTLDRQVRYLRLELRHPSAIFTEIALDAYSAAGWQALQDRLAEETRRAAERQAALAKARAEALQRPLIDLAPFGRLALVDEVRCESPGAEHGFSEAPAGASTVQEILGRPCRTLVPRPGEGAWISYRLGKLKLLRPGAPYVLVVDYPEDAPRSLVVVNTGNETALGFHTGLAVGDALHAKYVDSHCESLNLPLSGAWESWTLLLRLHDRFTERGLVRGDQPRPLTPEDGFEVTIACLAAENDPLSKGLAVARIALYEVVDPDALAQPLHLPPADLPQRRLFWREEMADGVIAGKTPETRGLAKELDWYAHKADLMSFLGMNTFAKDLLEFGACQHWDPSAYGGNAWVHFDARLKDLWGEIVKLMAARGFEVLPYYEYSGSKGDQGLGYQRRCKPLSRDDAYTHISWVESANADVTDPDTLTDFCRMLDATVLAFREQARFPGVWIRTRSQLPISFADATRERFAATANGGQAVSRAQLKADPALYQRYLDWWQLQRRDFFSGVRDYLRGKGLPEAFVLYSGCPGEPGVGFGDWTPRLVTDNPEAWAAVLQQPEHKVKDQALQTLSPAQVVEIGLYRRGLTAPGLNWGEWEVQHAQPADDPATYQGVAGVMLAQAFNRSYTVLDPGTMNLYRSPAGLTLIRHYPLNENMLYDLKDQDRLGYFLADMERAGPACMLGEVLAMAYGNPTQIGYLTGGNFGRGFSRYARDFNANFLALPALPAQRLEGAAADPRVVVQAIAAGANGTYLAVVNTGMTAAPAVRVKLPAAGPAQALASGETLAVVNGAVTVDLRPFQLLAIGIGTH
jgi:hypothetical protein